MLPSTARVRIIAAVARNGVIGKDGHLPWSIKEDWEHFKSSVAASVLIYGRRCYLENGSRAFPGTAATIVLSRNVSELAGGVIVCNSMQEALDIAKTRYPGIPVWIGGGVEVFAEAFSMASELHITKIHSDVEGDTVFPHDWVSHFTKLLSRTDGEDANFKYSFCVYGKDSL